MTLLVRACFYALFCELKVSKIKPGLPECSGLPGGGKAKGTEIIYKIRE